MSIPRQAGNQFTSVGAASTSTNETEDYDEYGYQKHISKGMNSHKGLNSRQIREEIKRFESVHPCIYQIYDILDCLSENEKKHDSLGEKKHALLDNLEQIRQQVLLIEDAFVNSHEWTLSRSVTEIRIGLIGGNSSGKSALIHRYLTGRYTEEETPEGGRYKKEVTIDNQSYLLLIRDEGISLPDVEFAQWADAVLLVFSVDSSDSFEQIDSYYEHMNRFRNLYDIPLALVATKDLISSSNPRHVMENEGREKASCFGKRCHYYETSSVHGHNIERVFKDTAIKAINYRDVSRTKYTTRQNSSFTSENSTMDSVDTRVVPNSMYATMRPAYPEGAFRSSSALMIPQPLQSREMTSSASDRSMSSSNVLAQRTDSRFRSSGSAVKNIQATYTPNGFATRSSGTLLDSGTEMTTSAAAGLCATDVHSASTSHLYAMTPGSTPTTQRKSRRISNIFRKDNGLEDKNRNLDVGQGRAIPIKQGFLYKKSSKPMLNREWKKKFVCIFPDGRLIYYPSLKDYQENKSTGKAVFLGLCTVRVAGRQHSKVSLRPNSFVASAANNLSHTPERKQDALFHYNTKENTSGGSDDAGNFVAPVNPPAGTMPNKKMTRRRGIGTGARNDREDDQGDYFEIVSHDQKHWEFLATSSEERDQWVREAERQIGRALETVMSDPAGKKESAQMTNARENSNKIEVSAILNHVGNNRCADCGSTSDVTWVSLNLGIVICIECAGIHRELGVHISRIRSLTLDNTSSEQLAIVLALGNNTANQIWEHHAPRDAKPKPEASREQKEEWVRQKYLEKKFVAAIRVDETLATQVVQAVLKKDVIQLSLLLTRAQSSDINCTVSATDLRTPLHLSCSNGSLETLQLLLWNHADPHALDEHGRSGLWYALQGGNNECVTVLYASGVPPDYGLIDNKYGG
ncbi:unnamed protein product, partial [Mesorhabditis belari]|uniref:Uncharacterized protein n=1 Tax=Mesorhabditis belari TaxID=2138241 RepID=A0AAF3E9G1_9BILA